MKIDFEPYTMICTETVNIYDVKFIIIDEEDKTVDCSDRNGFSIAHIYYDDHEEIYAVECDYNDRLTGNTIAIIKNGKVVI